MLDHLDVPAFGPLPRPGASGRKGLAYDWHELYVTAEMAGLDAELGGLLGVSG